MNIRLFDIFEIACH